MKRHIFSIFRARISSIAAASAACMCLMSGMAQAATVVDSGGMFGTQLTTSGDWVSTPYDIDGDGTNDISFVQGSGDGYLDKFGSFGLVGNIGGNPGSGLAWVRSSSTLVTGDGVGRNEMAADFRGVLLNSSDNWSKVHFSSGDGWVQWAFGAQSSSVKPVQFVREDLGENFSALQAAEVPEPASYLMFALGLGALVARSRGKKASQS